MIQFEKYIDNELNFFSSLLLKFKLKRSIVFRINFEQHKIVNNNLKQMFLINKAEKEIRKDSNFKNIIFFVDNYLNQNKREEDLLNYLGKAF